MKCLHLLEVLVFDTLTFTLSPKLMYLDLLKTSSKCVMFILCLMFKSTLSLLGIGVGESKITNIKRMEIVEAFFFLLCVI